MSWRLVPVQMANLSVQRFLSRGQAQNKMSIKESTAHRRLPFVWPFHSCRWKQAGHSSNQCRAPSVVIICSNSLERGNDCQPRRVSDKSSAGAMAELRASTVVWGMKMKAIFGLVSLILFAAASQTMARRGGGGGHGGGVDGG